MGTTTVRWIGGKQFVGIDSTQHSVVLSTPDEGVGMKPSELLLVALGGFVIASYSATDIMDKPLNLILAIVLMAVTVAIGWMTRIRKMSWVFILTTVAILLFSAFIFSGLFPRLLVSSTNPAWSLTIDNAAADVYSLRIMTIVAGIFMPLVLLYEGWTFWVFRKRISEKVSQEKLVY